MNNTATQKPNKLRAFHGDQTIKDKYVNRLAEHRRLENLIQGTGWEDGKGCAVGCTLENYSHKQYEIELGLPEWLARLEDTLFEGLPKGDAEQFAEDLLRVIPIGADVEPVRHLLAVARIEKSLTRLADNKEQYAVECRNALNLVKAWHISQVEGQEDDAAERSAAESAARSAVELVARSAAWSVARSAWSAVESAAWSAAESAESAAWSVAWSAAESGHCKWEAETLLQLLSSLKGETK